MQQAQLATWLQNCLCADRAVATAAEKLILQAEEQYMNSYLEALLTMAYQTSPVSILASMLFKKCVSSHWMDQKINEETKHNIRMSIVRQLPSIQEQQIANHLSEAISQICVSEVLHGASLPPHPSRTNVPYTCITLELVIRTLNEVAEGGEDNNRFSDMLSSISGTNGFVLMILQYAKSLLLPLHLAVKYIMANHKKSFLSNVPGTLIKELINLVSEKWSFAMVILTDILEDETASYDSPQEQLEEQILIINLSQVCSTSMRLLRRIIGIGFTMSEKNRNSTQEFSEDLHTTMSQFAELQQALFEGRNNPRALVDGCKMKHILEKQLVNGAKAIRELVESFPLSMAPYVGSILSFLLPILLAAPGLDALPGEGSFERKFLIHAIHCFAVSFESFSHVVIKENVEQVFEGVENMRQLLFVLLTRFLPLNNDELELCEEDPQEFIQQQLLESYQYDIKAAAKFLWLAMLRNCPYLPPIALTMISNFLNIPCDPSNRREFLVRREACYQGLGIGYNQFNTLIPFSPFFHSMILPDSKTSSPDYRMIKYQISNFFIQQWSRELTGQDLPTALAMILGFMKEDDYIVSVWGSIAFRNVCSGYILQSLAPELKSSFARDAVQAMIALSHKLQNDHVSTIIVDNIGRLCSVLGEELLSSSGIGSSVVRGLLQLWEHSKRSSVVRCSVLRTMATVVEAGATTSSPELEKDVSTLILLATSTSDAYMLYTCDGCRLWLKMIEREENQETSWIGKRYPKELEQRLIELLQYSSEMKHINPSLYIPILQHHCVIMPRILSENASKIVSFLGYLFVAPDEDSWKMVGLAFIRTACQIAKAQGIQLFEQIWSILIKDVLSQDVQSEEYNPLLHQVLLGSVLQAFSLCPEPMTQLLVSSSSLLPFIHDVQKHHEELMEDAILGRSSCSFLTSILVMERSPLIEHTEYILFSCVRANQLCRTSICNSLFEGCSPTGFLEASYRDLWRTDQTNQENIISTTIQKISSSHLSISAAAEQALTEAQQRTQEIAIPTLKNHNPSY